MKRETQTGFSRLSFFAGRGPSMATSFSVFCRDILPPFGAIVVVVVVVVLDDLALWQSYCGDETSSSLKMIHSSILVGDGTSMSRMYTLITTSCM